MGNFDAPCTPRFGYKMNSCHRLWFQVSHAMGSITEFYASFQLNGYEDKDKYEKEWLPLVEKYRQELKGSIPAEYQCELPDSIDKLVENGFNPFKYLYLAKLLTVEEFEITDQPAHVLVKKLASGELTAVQTLKAFAHRATIAHQFTNCALQLFIGEGLERAQYLDDYLKKNGKPIGPLHGLPISLKEHLHYRDKVTHAGYVSKVQNVTPKHGVTTQVLENLGAVFYVRTNEPQTLMHLDSNNNYIGLLHNPHNMRLSSGGSSSGEGAIVAFGGSALGVGSDIGGSIRAPAAFSGCHGLRPTSLRVSVLGGVAAGAGQISVLGVIGPIGRSISDLELWMKLYINEGKPWLLDHLCVPLPWRSVAPPKPASLKIVVMYDDGLVKPTPPIARGLSKVVEQLKALGVEVVEFKPIKTQLAFETVINLFGCDGNSSQRELLAASGEPLMKLTMWGLNLGEGKLVTAVENRKLNYTRDLLRQEYSDFLNDNKVDFFLSPTFNNVAPKLEEAYNCLYTALWNTLDFPALAFQTGLFQDPEIDVWGPEHATYQYRSQLEELECSIYDPQTFAGAPIALQLSGRRYEEEELLAAAKTIVDDILQCDLYKWRH
jgi:amidase